MSMDLIATLAEWKPQASAGKHWQVEPAAPSLGPPPLPRLLDPVVLEHGVSFNGALNEAARTSGLEDQKIAELIHISPGYFSRFMRGVGQQWARRLVAFMRETNSRAPLQWIAHQVGCDIVVRASRDARIRELESQLLKAKGLT